MTTVKKIAGGVTVVAAVAALALQSGQAAAQQEAEFGGSGLNDKTAEIFDMTATVEMKGQVVAAERSRVSQLRSDLNAPAGTDFTVRSVIQDKDGTRHVRLDRTYQGMRVIGGDVVVRRAPSGQVAEVLWDNPAAATVESTEPLLGDEEAKTRAGQPTERADRRSVERVVYMTDGGPKLALDVYYEGTKPDGLPTKLHTIIDAATGEKLDEYDMVATASSGEASTQGRGNGHGLRVGEVDLDTQKRGGQYQLRDRDGNYVTDGGRIVAKNVDDFGDGTLKDRHTVGVDALYGMQETYKYLRGFLGRNGIWDDGRGAEAKIHVGNNWTNATWTGNNLNLGDGKEGKNPLTAIDVIAHEMGHGVTFGTAAMVYRGEPGGLNESSSDILGTAVEFAANNPNDNPDYLIGEKINFRGDNKPLRYMDKPSRDGGRSRDCWSSDIGRINVHNSSGPLNHWFYLTAEGSGKKTINGVNYDSPTCDGSVIRGVGRDVAVKVWYRALTTKWTSRTDYKRGRDGLISSAKELYGAESVQCRTVEEALDAISAPKGKQACDKVGGDPTVTPTTVAPTTVAPTTVAPTTVAPTTVAPTTVAPTTEVPTTAPTTVAPGSPVEDFTLGSTLNGTETKSVAVKVADGAKLNFTLTVKSAEWTTQKKADFLDIQVNGVSIAKYDNTQAWFGQVKGALDLSKYAGQDVTIEFIATNDARKRTTFGFTDVSVG